MGLLSDGFEALFRSLQNMMNEGHTYAEVYEVFTLARQELKRSLKIAF